LDTTGSDRRATWRLLAAAVGPIAAVGLGLKLYNYLRFDNLFEFGQRYQLAGDRQGTARHFSPAYFWLSFRLYFLEPLRWPRHFPFVTDINIPAVPLGPRRGRGESHRAADRCAAGMASGAAGRARPRGEC
jgi:hypothetical protein